MNKPCSTCQIQCLSLVDFERLKWRAWGPGGLGREGEWGRAGQDRLVARDRLGQSLSLGCKFCALLAMLLGDESWSSALVEMYWKPRTEDDYFDVAEFAVKCRTHSVSYRVFADASQSKR